MYRLFNKRKKGFTLVELLVSLSIMLLIITAVILSQSKYTARAALKNVATDISLSLRQAQVYGTSVKEFIPGSSEFNTAYGITFNTTLGPVSNGYIFFGDRGSRNGIFDGSWSNCPADGSTECVQKTNFQSNISISDLCIIRSNGADMCSLGRVDITFVRPSTESNIVAFNAGGQTLPMNNVVGARVEIESLTGETYSVVVYTTGQISVQ